MVFGPVGDIGELIRICCRRNNDFTVFRFLKLISHDITQLVDGHVLDSFWQCFVLHQEILEVSQEDEVDKLRSLLSHLDDQSHNFLGQILSHVLGVVL